MATMREGPPSSPTNSDAMSSAAALMNEISILRVRLKELEEDNRSSIAGDGPTTTAGDNNNDTPLRKELAKLEDEKARQEKDFMNQMSSLAVENQKIMSKLQAKLDKCQAEKQQLEERLDDAESTSSDTQRWKRRLDDERNSHAEEVERLRENIAHADEEITESKQELDYLQQEVVELQSDKEEMLQEVVASKVGLENERQKSETYRLQLKESKGIVSRLQDELAEAKKGLEVAKERAGETNDSIIALEGQRDKLSAELDEARTEIATHEKANQKLRTQVEELNSGQQLSSDLDETRSQLSKQERANAKLRSQIADLRSDASHGENLALQLEEAEEQVLAQNRANAKLRAQVKDLRSDLEDQKLAASQEANLAAELEETRAQLETQERANGVLRTQIADLKADLKRKKRSTPVEDVTPISPTEKKTLEESVVRLEDRLQRFQTRLTEKNQTIDSLTSTLKEERRANKRLRKELKKTFTVHENMDASESVCSVTSEKQASRDDGKDQARENEFLRKRNKILSEDSSQSKKRPPEPLRMSPSRQLDYSPETRRSPAPNKKAWTPYPFSSPPNSAKKGLAAPNDSPRTPVSGIVASFERRIHRNDDDASTTSLTDSLSRDLKKDLEYEREVVADLSDQLRREKKFIAELKEQLLRSQETMHLPKSKLEKKLRSSEQEVARLRALVEDLEQEKRYSSRELERLKTELSYAQDIHSVVEEKKEEDDRQEEIDRLRSQVGALQPELGQALSQIEELSQQIELLKKELAKEREAVQQAEKRAKDLESTSEKTSLDMVRHRKQEAELTHLREELLKTQGALEVAQETTAFESGRAGQHQRQQESEMNQLKVELTKSQVAKAEMETDYENRVKELETELEALETEAEEELEEMRKELEGLQMQLTNKEEDIRRLEREKAQLCNNMTNVSSTRNDEFEELQSELIDVTAKCKSQAREIQTLRMKIEDQDSRKESAEQRLQDRIAELEEEISRAGLSQARSEELDRLRTDNQQLRETLRSLKIERRSLQERVDGMVSEKSSSKSVQVLRDRNVALKQEVEKLTKRLKKMEDSITRFTI